MSGLRSKRQKQKDTIKEPNDTDETTKEKVESESMNEMKQMFSDFVIVYAI